MRFNISHRTSLKISRLILVVTVLVLLFGYSSLGQAAVGTLDTTFGIASSGIVYNDLNAGSADQVRAFAIYGDGKIVAAGGSDTDIAITRYTADGVLDSTFSSDGINVISIGEYTDVANAATIQTNNRIVLVGSTYDGTNNHIFVARFNRNGSLDSTFGTGGVVVTAVSPDGDNVAHAVMVQSDGKILVGGEIDGDFALLRYTSNGILDTTFGGGDGYVTTDFNGGSDQAVAMALQNDGMILLSGTVNNGSSNDFGMVRYETDGDLDSSFGSDGLIMTDFGGDTDESATGIALQDDGSIILGGFRTTVDDDFALARYDPTGQLDPSFGTGGLITSHLSDNDDQATGIVIQGTGRIVLAGFTTSGDPNNEDLLMARYTSDGTLDTSFGSSGFTITNLGSHLSPGSYTEDFGLALILQADNKILVGGSVDYPLNSGDLNFFVARYDSPNSPPTVGDVVKSGYEESPVSFTETDFIDQFADLDGDVLRKIRVQSLPTSGTLTLNAILVTLDQEIPTNEIANLVFTPQVDFSGSTSFNWNGSDGLDYALTDAEVILTLEGVNDAPVLASIENLSGDEETLIAFTASASDADLPDILTFSLDPGAPAGASIDPLSGVFTWTPTESQGPWATSVTIRVTDNGIPNLSDTQTIVITVNEVNTTPVIIPTGDQNGDEGSLIYFIASATDNDLPANTFTYSLGPGAPEGSSIDPASGLFTWIPTETQGPGTYPLTILVSDNGSPELSDQETLTLTINEVNSAPTLETIDNQSISEGELLSLTAIASDPDLPANTLSYFLEVGAPTGASIDPESGLFTWTPGEDQGPGEYSITVRVSDDGVPSLNDQVTFFITVNEINNAPVLDPIGNQEVNEDNLLSFSAAASDSDLPLNSLVFSLDPGAPSGATIDPGSGLFTWTPGEVDSPGSYSITVRVSDNGIPSQEDFETIEVNVYEVNDAPSFTGGPDLTLDEDAGLQSISAWATGITPGSEDEATQALTFILNTDNPALFTSNPSIDPQSGDLGFTPADNAFGSALVTVILQDDGGTSNGGVDTSEPYSFRITVNPLNDLPLVSSFNKISNPNQVIHFSLGDFSDHFSDIDGDPLATIKFTALPAAGILELDGNPVILGQEISALEDAIQALTFTPGLNWTGTIELGWNGSDGIAYAESPASIEINISDHGLLYLPLVIQAH